MSDEYLCPYRVSKGGGYVCRLRGTRARSQVALKCAPSDNTDCARKFAEQATAPLCAERKDHDRARRRDVGEWEQRG